MLARDSGLDSTSSQQSQAERKSQPAGIPDAPRLPETSRLDRSFIPWRLLFLFTTRQDVPLLVLAIVSAIGASIPTPAQAFLMGKVFDGFIKYASFQISAEQLLQQEQKWVMWLVCVAAGSWLFHFLLFGTWIMFGEIQARRARERLYTTLSENDISWYDLQDHGIKALLPQLEKQVRDLQLAVSQPIGGLVAISFCAMICLGQAFYSSWRLTLVTLATMPLVVVVLWYFNAGMQSEILKQQEELSGAQRVSLTALSAMDTVKSFNTQETELARYIAKIIQAAVHYCTIARKTALQMGFLTFLVQAMFVQAFYYGGVLISQGDKTPAEVVTTFFSAISAFQAAQGLLPQVIILEKGRNSAAMLRNVLHNANHRTDDDARGRILRPLHCVGGIRFERVTFRYPGQPGRCALDDISLSFPAGETVFVVGASGSGKSTIGQLLVHFYAPERGRILLDGQDLRLLDVKWLRSKVTLVEQTSVLFNDTILVNLKHGQIHPEQSHEDSVNAAIEFALLRSVISDLPDGLDTMVGQDGASLSGGQCQRVALARARLRDTPVLILDECTSALDQISRDLIMAAVRRWRCGKTTIIITHELSQIGSGDYAVIMQDGNVVHQGYRKDLEKTIGSVFLSQGSSAGDKQQQVGVTSTTYEEKRRLSQPALRMPRTSAAFRRSNVPSLFTGARFLAGIPIDLASLSSSVEDLNVSCKSTERSTLLTNKDSRCLVISPVDAQAGGSSLSQPKQSQTSDYLVKTGKLASKRRLHLSGPRKLNRSGLDTKLARTAKQNSFHVDSLKAILSRIWPNLQLRHRVCLLLGFWAGTVHAVCTPIFSYVLAKLLALYARPDDHSRQSLTYSMAILILAALDGFHFFLSRYTLEQSAQAWVDNLRYEAMRRLLYQPKAFFDRPENDVYRIVQHLDRGGEEMRALLGRFVGLVYIALLIILSSLIWAFTAQWKMTVFALITAPYLVFVTNLYSKTSDRMEVLSNNASLQVASCYEESFGNIRTVRSLNLQSHFKRRFIKAVAEAASTGARRSLTIGFFYGLSDSASAFSIAFVFYVGSRLVSGGENVENIVQVFVVLVLAITKVAAILDYIPQIGASKVNATKVLNLASIPEGSHEFSGDIRLTSIGTIELDKLTFAYESRAQSAALKDVSMTISAGQTIAIVGGSGSGKSTVAKLITKLYSVPRTGSSGSRAQSCLRIAGREIHDIETSALRSMVGVVPQASPVFSSTISDNITYGLPNDSEHAKPENVIRAAHQAGILDFVKSLPSGFETCIGDGGTGLSGGQVQRIAIARALVRQPSVLILDEATSALDVDSAATIRATLKSLIEHRTTDMTIIIITHNREMMQIAEQVVVLDNGRIVESGAFEELIARRGPLSYLLSSGAWETEQ